MEINAAVVSSFDRPPAYAPFELPDPSDGQALVDVLAVGLHPRVRTGASGRHYTSTGELPMIPGVDGVGRRADGRVVYFVADDDVPGPMATRTLIDPRRSIELPPEADPVQIAAAMNPAMSSWVALRRRVPLQPGQSVLILGATGNAGRMAVQVARRLGAGHVIGAGRDRARLADSGADATAPIDDPAALAEVAAEADIVLDYVWAEPAAAAMLAILRARADRSRELNWVQIGSMAGPELALPSVALRSANLRLQGNGQGAVSTRAYLAELPALTEEITSGGLAIPTRAVPLRDVASAWTAAEEPGVRTVLVP